MQYPPNSRYHATETIVRELADGTKQVYLARRFLPQPERLVALSKHVVVEGDRIDNLSARYLGDSEQYWRICDANRAMNPPLLTSTIGRVLVVTLPEGVPGVPNA